jgi:hypothetical protein
VIIKFILLLVMVVLLFLTVGNQLAVELSFIFGSAGGGGANGGGGGAGGFREGLGFK